MITPTTPHNVRMPFLIGSRPLRPSAAKTTPAEAPNVMAATDDALANSAIEFTAIVSTRPLMGCGRRVSDTYRVQM